MYCLATMLGRILHLTVSSEVILKWGFNIPLKNLGCSLEQLKAPEVLQCTLSLKYRSRLTDARTPVSQELVLSSIAVIKTRVETDLTISFLTFESLIPIGNTTISVHTCGQKFTYTWMSW